MSGHGGLTAPALIDFRVEREENVWPMVPARRFAPGNIGGPGAGQ